MRHCNLERAKWVIAREVLKKAPHRWSKEEREDAMWFIALALLEQEEVQNVAKTS